MVKGPGASGYEVVFATCNGEEFLDQQLVSSLSQTVLPERLLVASRESYVMPADQDDIWDLKKAERLIDRVGQPLAAAFHRQQGLESGRQGRLALPGVFCGTISPFWVGSPKAANQGSSPTLMGTGGRA